MEPSSRAPFYDLFKLTVTIILLLIFLWIWMRPAQALPTELPVTTLTPPPATRSPAVAPVPSTSALPSASPTPTALPTSTSQPDLTSTVIPSLTVSPVPEVLPTPIVEIPEETNDCEAVSRSQLQVGMKATIVRYLNFRSSPGILNNWILTNIPNTQVDIIGGPACTRYEYGGSYLWWQIKLPNGLIGWSAEASAFGKFYFMEPVP
jgi:hypothetical protein